MIRTAAGILIAVATAATPIAAQAAQSVRASSAVVKRAPVAAPIAYARSGAQTEEENGLVGAALPLVIVSLLAASAIALGIREAVRDDEPSRSPN
jgi:hypothetical protein